MTFPATPETQRRPTTLILSLLKPNVFLWYLLPQGVHGGYQLTEPGVLLPASLSPLAPAPRPLPPFSAGLASVEAQLAAQGLAGSGGMLAAVAAAWQVGGSAGRGWSAAQGWRSKSDGLAWTALPAKL